MDAAGSEVRYPANFGFDDLDQVLAFCVAEIVKLEMANFATTHSTPQQSQQSMDQSNCPHMVLCCCSPRGHRCMSLVGVRAICESRPPVRVGIAHQKTLRKVSNRGEGNGLVCMRALMLWFLNTSGSQSGFQPKHLFGLRDESGMYLAYSPIVLSRVLSKASANELCMGTRCV